MAKFQKNIYIFILILSQSLLAILSGLSILYFFTGNTISPNTYMGSVYIGSLNRKDATAKIEDYYENIINSGHLSIKLNNSDEFRIKYSEIDASIDYDAALNLVSGGSMSDVLSNLIYGRLISKKRVVSLPIAVNEGKLKQKLVELSTLVDSEPVNADIYIKDDKVVKVSEMNGLKLNINNGAQKIMKELGMHIDSSIEFKSADNFEIESTAPKFTLKDFEGADEIISRSSNYIDSKEVENSAKLAASAIDKVLVRPEDMKNGEEAGVFSFNKYLSAAKETVEQDNKGYNLVASTLYKAVLMAGIKQDTITRTPHKTVTDNIEPGLDAIVFGNSIDFKFKNTLSYPVVIFAQEKDNQITVSLVSKKQESSIKYNITTEVDQEFEPSVISVENQDLKPGEKRLISSGKQGLRVKVYRSTLKGGSETAKKLLYTDKYDAVEAIVQIGPNTKWDNTGSK